MDGAVEEIQEVLFESVLFEFDSETSVGFVFGFPEVLFSNFKKCLSPELSTVRKKLLT